VLADQRHVVADHGAKGPPQPLRASCAGVAELLPAEVKVWIVADGSFGKSCTEAPGPFAIPLGLHAL